jgi:hypothetical protein
VKDRKKKVKAFAEDEAEFDEAIDDLLEAIVNDSNTHLTEEQDPFDLYVHRVRAHLHADLPSFRERFIKGYQALFDEVGHP